MAESNVLALQEVRDIFVTNYSIEIRNSTKHLIIFLENINKDSAIYVNLVYTITEVAKTHDFNCLSNIFMQSAFYDTRVKRSEPT